MRVILFSLLFFLNICYSFGQIDSLNSKASKLSKFTSKWAPKHVLIDVWIFKKDGTKDFGHLYNISDSAITLIPQIELKRMNRDLMSTNYSNINVITIREDNRKSRIFRKSIPISFFSGLTAGCLAYFIRDNGGVGSFSAGFISVTGIGFIAGTIVGSFKLTIPIKGNYNNFKKYRTNLRSISAE